MQRSRDFLVDYGHQIFDIIVETQMHIPGELQSSTFVPYVTAILFSSNTAEPHGKRANILNTIHYPVESRQGALTDVLNSKK